MTEARQAFLSIGEVLVQLLPEFPDVTISKIRFLEAEGLVEPERTASGYRRFGHRDLSRLRYVLSQQRDHYLPLRVIKDNLEAIDRGMEPGGPEGGPRAPHLTLAPELPEPVDFAPPVSDLRLSRRELLTAAGVSEEQLADLEQYGLLAPCAGGSSYDADALVVARTVAAMARFGIEPRHLRPFRSAADREIGLVEQVVTPLVRQRGPEAQARAAEAVRELSALSVRLHTTLVRAGLGPQISR